MPFDKHDLLAHYDEAAGALRFVPVAPNAATESPGRSTGAVVQPLSELRAMGADAAEQLLGRMLLALVDQHASKKIAIRDYDAEFEQAHGAHVAELELRAHNGDGEALFELAQEKLHSAMSDYSMADLQRAEALLNAAIAQNHAGARAWLDTFAELKGSTERRIARRPATK